MSGRFSSVQIEGGLKYIGLILYRFNGARKVIQIPLSVEIGYGLYIAHRGYIVVNKVNVKPLALTKV